MNPKAQLLTRPGIYHPLLVLTPHTREQAAWLAETCRSVEHFVDTTEPARDPHRLSLISAVLHLLSDVLFVRLGEDAAWSAVTHADVSRVMHQLPRDATAAAMRICARFYETMREEGRGDEACCQRWSSDLHIIADFFEQSSAA